MSYMRGKGFTLIELMVALVLTLLSSAWLLEAGLALTKTTIKLNASLDKLSRSLELSAWFEQVLTSRYGAVSEGVIAVSSQSFINNLQRIKANPVGLEVPSNSSTQQSLSNSIVVSTLALRGCNGFRFNHPKHTLFSLVNQIYLVKNELRCRSFDGQVVTGGIGNKGGTGLAVVRGISGMQMQYLIKTKAGWLFKRGEQLAHGDKVKAVYIDLWLDNDFNRLGKKGEESDQLSIRQVSVLADSFANKLSLVIEL